MDIPNKSQNTRLPICNIKKEPQEPVQIKENCTDTLTYNCSVCDKKYNNWEKMVLHKYFKHKNNLPYKCGICGEAFVVNGQLNLHLLEHKDYQRTIKPVAVHLALSHNYSNGISTKCKQFKCTNCVYETNHEEQFSYHRTVCNQQTFKSSRIKFATTKNITQNRPIEFKCVYCKISCKSERVLIEHIKSHHPNQRRSGNNCLKLPTTKCQLCGMIITKPNLQRHIKSQHSKIKPFKCPHCSISFKYFSSQKKHILKSHTTN